MADTHCFRIQPYTHGVITGSHDIHRSHSRHTGQLVYQIQVGKVGQVNTIINTVTTQCKHHHNIGGLLLHRHSLHLHCFGQRIQRYADPVLYHHSRHIDIGPYFESHGQRISARCGGIGAHIQHSVHTVHLLFNGDTDSLCYSFSIGPRIYRTDLHGRRRNIGVLRHGQYV